MDPPVPASRPLLDTRAALAATVGVLVAYAVLRRWVIPDGAHFGANLAMVGVLAGLAAAAGLSASDLGLSRATAGDGLRVGTFALLIVTGAVALALVLPWTRELFDDDRLDVDAWGMAYRALVRIPLGTVLFEELAFRGVLVELLRRQAGTITAIVGSAVLFGLWHLPPLIGDAESGPGRMVGTVLATTVAGLVFAALRVRTESLIAPVLAHCGTNSVTFALAWWAH